MTNHLSRAWDEYDVYLFDIDGTLLNCTDAVHYFAFCDTLTRVAGRPVNLEGVVTHGNTDVGILRDALHRAGVAEAQWRPNIAQLRTDIAEYVEGRREELCVAVLPGAREVLAHLRLRGALLGVATGNLERVGRLKLAHSGLLDSLDFGGFSDQCEYRTEVFAYALALARAARDPQCSACVIGDTPADIQAAHDNGLEVIAVSTGIYSFENLARYKPELCVPSLEALLGAVPHRDDRQ